MSYPKAYPLIIYTPKVYPLVIYSKFKPTPTFAFAKVDLAKGYMV
jgi:hypothetical protein